MPRLSTLADEQMCSREFRKVGYSFQGTRNLVGRGGVALMWKTTDRGSLSLEVITVDRLVETRGFHPEGHVSAFPPQALSVR